MVRPARCHRTTRLWGQASPPTSRILSLGNSVSIVASRVGQQQRHVTLRSRRKSASSSASSVTPGGPGTRVAPAINGTQNLLHREIEGDRHALIDTIPGRKPVPLRRDPDEVADAGMLDDDALGIAGRPRGIDDVADPIDRRPDLAVGEGRARLRVDGPLRGVEKNVAHRRAARRSRTSTRRL